MLFTYAGFLFLVTVTLVVVSVVVNTNHAGPSALAKGIAALPPLILLGTLELVAAQGRRLNAEAITPVVLAHGTSAPVVPAPHAAAAVTTPTHASTQVVQGVTATMPVQVAAAPSGALSVPVPASVPAAQVPTAGTLPSLSRVTPVSGVVSGYDDPIDGELEQLVESFGDGQTRRPRASTTRRPMRVRAEEPLS
jgi:hypothetical protein